MKFRIKPFALMIILVFSFLLSACANQNPTPENPVPEKNLPTNAPDSGTESSTANNAFPESESRSVENEPILNNSSVAIEDLPLSLSESKQDITAKLETADLNYSEHQPDYPGEANYDSYYNVAEGCIQVYFLHDSCVRIRLTDLQSAFDWKIQTAQELCPGDTYAQMIELYGDDFETYISYKGIYTVYRYSIEDFICEVGIPGEDTDEIYNIDIYLPSQSPVYKCGEEISVENEPILNNSSVTIEDLSLSLSESKQDITAKLDTADLNYSEHQPDYPEEANYDSYYNVVEGCIQVYFLNDSCVRIRLTDLQSTPRWKIQTAQELRPEDTYMQMIELYGDDFEAHTYSYKGIYTVYRYSIEDFICEVGIPGEDSDEIYNIDIYFPSQSPIYRYGGEIPNIENGPIINNSSITIGDMSLSLSESKQDITAKLETAGLNYMESFSDYPDEDKYDSRYGVSDYLQIYFLNDSCVRIRLINYKSSPSPRVQTAQELRTLNTYTQMIELYGDDFETHTYSYKGIYTVYRYSIEDFIREVGIPGEGSEKIYNIDIYFPSQSPIYEYGEEVSETTQ